MKKYSRGRILEVQASGKWRGRYVVNRFKSGEKGGYSELNAALLGYARLSQ
jgi:hypothetical protein